MAVSDASRNSKLIIGPNLVATSHIHRVSLGMMAIDCDLWCVFQIVQSLQSR